MGVRGEVYLAPKWYAKYYLDAGGGESELTWQGYLGAAYRFEKVEMHGGYRYLDYEFKSDDELRDLTVKGPPKSGSSGSSDPSPASTRRRLGIRAKCLAENDAKK